MTFTLELVIYMHVCTCQHIYICTVASCFSTHIDLEKKCILIQEVCILVWFEIIHFILSSANHDLECWLSWNIWYIVSFSFYLLYKGWKLLHMLHTLSYVQYHMFIFGFRRQDETKCCTLEKIYNCCSC
jgi:hypothetical protein